MDNKKQTSGLHDGHRERIREKYKATGLSGFAEHEVLELLLFYANKRGDTNPTAHRLIKQFGSLTAVLEADYEELLRVEGVGDVAATLITLVPELFRRYAGDKADNIRTIKKPQDLKDYLTPRFFGLKNEHVAVLCLDSQGRINNFVFVSEGSLKFAQIDVRKVAQIALQNNAESVIIVHNHPGGLASPSRGDAEATIALVKSLALINIRVADHIILSDDDFFSMAMVEKFSPIFYV